MCGTKVDVVVSLDVSDIKPAPPAMGYAEFAERIGIGSVLAVSGRPLTLRELRERAGLEAA